MTTQTTARPAHTTLPQPIREAAVGLFPPAAGGAGEASAQPREFRVILVREGLAKSGRYFTRRVVEDIAAAAEGLRAFADHPTPAEDRERPARSVRDVVGFYKDATAVVEPGTGLVQAEATLHLFESATWLADVAREVLASGLPQEVIGLSIDAVCLLRKGRPPGIASDVVVSEALVELRSVDVVTRASAGGKFLQVRESENMNDTTFDPSAAVREAEHTLAQLRDAQASAAETSTALREQRDAVREEQVALACSQALIERLGRAKLPAPVEQRVKEQWAYVAGRWDDAADYVRHLEAALDKEVESVGQLRDLFSSTSTAGAPSPITGMGAQRLDVTLSEADRQRLVAEVAMDRLFGLEGGEDLEPQDTGSNTVREDASWQRARQLGLIAGAPRWRGIREAYVALTGDALVSGVVRPDGSIVREANEVTSGVLNQALLNSMTKRLVRDYRGQPQDWKKFCEIVPLENFKSQDRVRLHDFASLSTVAEGGTYTNLPWDDSREAYAASKRGNLVVVTREAILNDDLRAIRKIPDKLSRAAYITLNEFVYSLFTGNPTMADSTKVFDDGVQTSHGNRGTAALSSAAIQAAITAMMKQTDSAGKRLSLKPRYLLVPADVYFTSLTIVNSSMVPGSSNNDINVLRGVVEPIPVSQFSDATDYYLICDPKDIESIEIGFVGGKQEPELLTQDAPLLGQVFTNDQISFKVRWEFGGAWLDYRGAFWSQVAG